MLLDKDQSILLLIDVQEKLIPAVLNADALLAKCEWLLQLAQTLNIPIIASEQYPHGLGVTHPRLRAYLNVDHCIPKVSFSCMADNHFIDTFKASHKKQAVLIGMEAHVCVLQTAIEMIEANFEVFVVVDAVSSRGQENFKYGLKRMKAAGAQLLTSEMVFFEWLRKAGTPQFKELSKRFLFPKDTK